MQSGSGAAVLPRTFADNQIRQDSQNRTAEEPTAGWYPISNQFKNSAFRAMGLLRRDAVRRVLMALQTDDRVVRDMLSKEVFEGDNLETYVNDNYLQNNFSPRYEIGGGMLPAIARLYGIELRIYQPGDDDTAVLFQNFPCSPCRVVNLLHIYNAGYDRLEIAAGAAPTIVKLVPVLPSSSHLLEPLHQSSEHRLTVVLDLDETLISNRCSEPATARPYGEELIAYLRSVPGLELVLWTASVQDTAEQALSETFHHHDNLFDEAIYRDPSWFTEPKYAKELNRLGRINSLIVDNTVDVCKPSLERALIVADFPLKNNEMDATLRNVGYAVQAIFKDLNRGLSVEQAISANNKKWFGLKLNMGSEAEPISAFYVRWHLKATIPLGAISEALPCSM